MKFKELLAWCATILGIELDGEKKVSFNKTQAQTLNEAANKDNFAELFEAAFNQELEGEAANKHITEFMQAQADGEDVDGDGNVIDDPAADTAKPKATDATLLENVQSLTASNKELQGQVKKLVDKPEIDTPMAIVKKDATDFDIPKHSKTHLFASADPLNTIAGKPWNESAANIKNPIDIANAATTDWNTVNIDKINTEFGAYSRKNLNKIVSLLRDAMDIPAHWNVISGVSDEVVFAALLAGKITQGKKKKWLPKNKHKFIPQKGKIYDVQIDMAWTGFELKSIEKTWLNSIFNTVASSPYKMSFVEYLVAELIKQARKEDKIGLFKGVYYPNDDMDIAGDFLNAQSGFLKLVDGKKGIEYNAFKVGTPTTANVYDYINGMVEKLPYDFRILPGLKFGLSKAWMKSYQDARETAKGTNTDYNGKEVNVDGYANIAFITHPQFEGTDFMYITTEDNVSVLMDKPGEEGVVTFEKSKRDINAFADYKLGIYVSVFGAQMADGNIVGFENQLFFSNDVPVLEDVFAPVPANVATPDLQYHHSLMIGEHNTAATDITNFIGATAGKKVFLRGNNDTNPSTVKNNANIIIGADVILTTTVELVLMARSDGKFVKLYETDLSVASTAVALAADATTAGAGNGTEFVTVANTIATAITNITNAVEGETYKITGGSSTNATTIANAGNFTLSAAMTLSDGAWIELYYNGSKLIETQRG